MAYGEPVADVQHAFLKDGALILKSLPEGISHIAKACGISSHKLRTFLSGATLLTDVEFSSLCNYVDARYEYDEWDGGHFVHWFRLLNSATYFVKSNRALSKLYDQISGGDHDLACEIIPNHGAPFINFRLILVSQCVKHSLFVLPLDRKINELHDRSVLPNFAGYRAACDGLVSEIEGHVLNLRESPETRYKRDFAFFKDKDLVFEQLGHSPYAHESYTSYFMSVLLNEDD